MWAQLEDLHIPSVRVRVPVQSRGSDSCDCLQGRLMASAVGQIVGLQSQEIKQMASEYAEKVSRRSSRLLRGSGWGSGPGARSRSPVVISCIFWSFIQSLSASRSSPSFPRRSVRSASGRCSSTAGRSPRSTSRSR